MSKTHNRLMRILRGNVLAVFFALLFFHLTPAFGIDVKLAWDPNTEANLASYKVYFGTASRTYGTPINIGNITTYTATGLAGTVYYFAVTAVDTGGNESGFSSEVVVNLLCTFSISPASVTVGQGASTGSVAVTSSTGCNWAATSNASWITVTSGSGGSGSGTVNYSLAVNATGLPRTGTMTIAGQTLTVTQTGISCTYAISSTAQSFGASGGTGTVNVTSSSSCNWTAVSNVGWVNISSGGIGIGNGTVGYSVSTNTTTSSRSGTLTIAGRTFTVTQAGISCTYSISPTSQDVSLSGASGSVTVTTAPGCNWTAASNDGWLTVTSGGSGSGPGNSNYLVAANTTGSSRTGTITIAGRTFTVTQDVPACSYSISPTSRTFSESADTGSVAVTGTSGCTWTASSNASWITITTVIFGTNGIVNYSVAANTTTASRTGTLTIAGQTYTVIQSGITCSYSISPTSQSFAAGSDAGSVGVTTPTGCGWTAASNDGWLTITSGGSGSGAGVVNYSVAANPTINSRTGTLIVAGQTFTVTQQGVTCTYLLFPASQSFADGAGSGGVTVLSPSGCNWTAASNDSWLTVTGGASGSGNGAVNYSVAASTTTSSRTGTLTIAGQTFTVTQAGIPCTYSISPTSQSFTDSAGAGVVTVTSNTGCSWTATSNAGWLSVTSGGGGSGNGTVNYSVAANTTINPRTGTLTIAGQTFTVTQAGISCTYSISPGSQSFSASAGTGSVTMSSITGCTWTAASNVTWLSVTSGGSGSGNGTVNYSVAANTTINARTGTLTVGGQTLVVTQAGIPCTYSISPTSQSVSNGAANLGTIVTSPTGCNWTATSNDGWITIFSGGTGSGNGSVNYSVSANTTTSTRTGTLTVAGQTLTVTQAGITCTYFISPTSQSFGETAGTGTVTVTATSGCSWVATSNTSWLTITSGGTGSGNGSVNYSVAANTTINSRTGTLTIAGQTFTVTQAGLGCTYSISPTSQSFSDSAQTGSVMMTSLTGCTWTAASNASWLIITSGGTGSGSGSVNYSIAANTSAIARTGTLTVAGQTLTVTQAGVGCTYSVSPASQSFSSSAGTGSVTVTSLTGCNWTATSNAPWLTITSGATGSGNGSGNYLVAANTTTSSRTGTITIAGQTHTVTQAGTSCTYSIVPTSQSFTDSAGTGSVAVTAPAGCNWTTSSNATWVTITSGGSGSGNGNVNYLVAANTATSSRTGTLTVAGQTLTLTQSGISCSFSISPSSQSFGEGAGNGSVAVTAPSGCNWTAASNATWLTISSGASGSANGTVGYSVAANTTTGSRSGTLTVAGQTFTVTQAGIGCTYSLSVASQSFGDSGETGTVALTATTGCAWVAASNASWLTISSGANGSGNGIVNYSVAPNGTSISRTGTLLIAGQTFTVTQAGASCTYSISPNSQSFINSGGTGTVVVTATAGCSWTTASNASWLTISSGGSGVGNGTVNYSVAANTAGTRIGTLTIAGQTFTVTQSEVGCVTSVSPVSQSFGDTGGTGSLSVAAPGGCAWTPSSTASWITISFVELPGGTAGGSGTVNFLVAANTTTNFRTGTVRIEGLTFTVSQAGLGCSASITPTIQSFNENGGSGSLAVTVTGPCGSTPQSNASWITVTSVVLPGSESGGTGLIRFAVAPNPSFDSRTGTVTVAGQTFTITQAGTGCVYSVFPDSQAFNNSAGTGTVSVIAASGCPWTASSGVSWITITSGDSGTGNGTLSYAVEAAGAISFRSGFLIVAGQNVTVTQTSTHTTSFSQFANGADWTSSLVLTNPSPTEMATGTATFYNSAGDPVSLSINGQAPATSVSFAIEPLGGTTLRTDGSGALVSGSIQVSANGPVAGVVKYSHRTIGLTGVGESVPLRSLMTFVVNDANRGINTGIALTNVQSGTAQITLSLRGLDGREVAGGAASQSIPANGQISKFVHELFPTANTANFQGTLIVTATGLGGRVTATAIQIGTFSGQFASLPVVSVDPAPITRQLFFAQFVNGGGWASSLYVVNPSSSLSGNITSFLDGQGNLLDITGPGGTTLDTVIEPLGGAVLETDVQAAQSVGSARLLSSHPVGGVLVFSSPSVGTAGVAASIPMTRFITPIERNANGSTGVAIASVGSAVNLRLELRNQSGVLVTGGQLGLDLPADGHLARYLEQLFPEADTANFEGTLSVFADGGSIVGTALLLGARKDELAALPVTSIR